MQLQTCVSAKCSFDERVPRAISLFIAKQLHNPEQITISGRIVSIFARNTPSPSHLHFTTSHTRHHHFQGGFLAGQAPAEMVVKTKDGWVSRKEIARKEGHYLKAHQALISHLGPAADDPSLLKAKADELFRKIDTDKSGCICDSELKVALSEVGIELNKKEVKEFIMDFDGNGDGLIDMAEFEALLSREVATYKKHTEAGCIIS